jgi:hypothetical protein
MNDFLSKPVSVQGLRDAIERTRARRTPRPSMRIAS